MTLVITIVILIILAGVSINMLLKEDGIITMSKYAKEQTLIAQYQERIEIIKAETRLKYDNEITLENIKNTFDEDNQKYWINKTEIITDNGKAKLKLITNNGYIFYITDTTTVYKGKGTIEETPIVDEDISSDIVSFTPEDASWQVDNVKDALDYLFKN